MKQYFLLALSIFFMNTWMKSQKVFKEEDEVKKFQKSIFHIETKTGDSRVMGMVNKNSKGVTRGIGFAYKHNHKKYIITCFHVVSSIRATKAPVYIYIAGKKYRLKLLGGDNFYDIAVLQLIEDEGSTIRNLEPLKFGKKEAGINEKIFVPLPNEKIKGIVIEKAFLLQDNLSSYNYIKIDKRLKKGNSGCPMLNEAGEVVGIGNRIDAHNTYGLKSDIAKKGIDQLIDDYKGSYTSIDRVYIGVAFYQSEKCKRNEKCQIKIHIKPNSPAYSKLKDLPPNVTLIAVDGESVKNITDVLQIMENFRFGDNPKKKIKLKFSNNKEYEIQLKKLDRTDLTNISKVFFNDFTNIELLNAPLKIRGKDNKIYRIKKGGLYEDTGDQQIMYAIDRPWEMGVVIRLSAIYGRLNLLIKLPNQGNKGGEKARKIKIRNPRNKRELVQVLFY